MSNPRPDPTDERILRLLVRNARASWREIGDEVGLSANAVAQRVRRLETAGWIRGYTTQLDDALADRTPAQQALVLLRVATEADSADIEARLATIPSVAEVLDVAGPVDYYVRIRHTTPQQLYAAVSALRELPGVIGIETRVVLREVIDRS
jgi:Lrp/AsnC family leucine-responsive transcriptional regulator